MHIVGFNSGAVKINMYIVGYYFLLLFILLNLNINYFRFNSLFLKSILKSKSKHARTRDVLHFENLFHCICYSSK